MKPAWRRALIAIAIFAALALGALLRLWNLGPQVMSDDELHAVRTALGNPIPRILVTYQRVDNTIPLTALYRFFLDRGLKLTEMAVRLPAVLAGLALLVLAPLWIARRLGWVTAMLFAALLAISPGLVFYSRIARSYAPIVLLGFGALVAFEAWWRKPEDWRPGGAYVLLAALAAWFHLGAATFVVSPFLFAAGDLFFHRERRRLAGLLLLGAATVFAFLAFLVPARKSLAALVAEKSGELHLSWRLAGDVLQFLAGTRWVWVAGLFWATAIVGLVRLYRRDARFAAFTATAVLGHLAGLFLLAPQGHEHPLILGRYLLIALPWMLVWVAALTPVSSLLFLLLVVSGPFTNPHLWRSPFAHHNDYMAVMWRRSEVGPRQVPRLYRELEEPGTVLEYPWYPIWRLNRAFYLYQEVHGRDVVVAPARALLADDRLAFRNMVPGTPEGFLASRARWLVVHRNLSQEESRIYPPMEIDPRHRQLFRTFGHGMVLQLYSEWGRPDWIDRRVAVWDLERIRTLTPRPPLPSALPDPRERGRGNFPPTSPPAARLFEISPSPGEGVGEVGEGAGG